MDKPKRLGAMILCGGASERMGAAKASLDWLGRRAVDRVAATAAEVGAADILTVGPESYGFPSIADDEHLGGPVGGVIAGARVLAVGGAEQLLVLAVDAPTLTAADLRPLLDAPSGAAFEGLHFPFVAPVAALPADARADWPVGRLIERAGLERIACPPGALARLRGANTPAEREALLDELVERQNAQTDGDA